MQIDTIKVEEFPSLEIEIWVFKSGPNGTLLGYEQQRGLMGTMSSKEAIEEP